MKKTLTVVFYITYREVVFYPISFHRVFCAYLAVSNTYSQELTSREPLEFY